MPRKEFTIVGTIGPETKVMGTTHAEMQKVLSSGFQGLVDQAHHALAVGNHASPELQRAGYVAWLDTQPADAFAPATREDVLALYDARCGTEDLAQPKALGTELSITERIAQSEMIPARKAALDRARVRHALATIRMSEIYKMSPEQAIEALCETPEGRAQYEHILTRTPGTPYRPLGSWEGGVSPAELIASLASSSDLAAEFEQASKDVRGPLGLAGGRSVLQTLAEAVAGLLVDAGGSLAAGVESSGPFEPEWSRADKAVLGEIAVVVPKLDPDKVPEAAPADIQKGLELLVQIRASLMGGLESGGPNEPEWNQEDKALVDRINGVLDNVYARELLGSSRG